jgi:CRISPR type III-A/MTUBE-associated protein Csm6
MGLPYEGEGCSLGSQNSVKQGKDNGNDKSNGNGNNSISGVHTIKYVLFSAVGDTDPMRGGYDGAMLHIVRYFRPARVYLFFTAAMARRERKSGACESAVRLLLPDCEIYPEYTDIENAADFDAYHSRFDAIINRIGEENPDAEILLNISSGTPQIKTAMCLEAVTHNIPLQPVQVAAPDGKSNRGVPFSDINARNVRDETDNSHDTLGEAPARFSKPDLTGLKRGVLKRQVRGLIENYEYKGAHDLVGKNAALFTERLRLLLRHAYMRSLPDESGAERAARDMRDRHIFGVLYPVKEGEARQVCEFCLAARLRKDRGQLADFILRATALTEVLLRAELKDILHRKYGDLYKYYLDREKAERVYPGLMAMLDEKYNGFNDGKPVAFDVLIKIAGFARLAGYGKLFALHETRNIIAHGLLSVTNAHLKQTGTDADELQKHMEALISRIYGVNPGAFAVYKQINDRIKELLDR